MLSLSFRTHKEISLKLTVSLFITSVSSFIQKLNHHNKQTTQYQNYHLNDNETTKSHITDNYSTQCTDQKLMYSIQLQSLLFSFC